MNRLEYDLDHRESHCGKIVSELLAETVRDADRHKANLSIEWTGALFL